MVYWGDQRFELHADWPAIRRAQRYARIAEATGLGLEGMAHARGLEVVPLPLGSNTLGLLTRPKHVLVPSWQGSWLIALNDRLDRTAATTVLGHEYGHSWLAVAHGGAHCQPRRGRSTVEEMANAIGALAAVPFAAIAGVPPEDDLTLAAVAARLGVALPYVYIRSALAVILGERSGVRADAFSTLELALCAHEGWVRDVADRLRRSG